MGDNESGCAWTKHTPTHTTVIMQYSITTAPTVEWTTTGTALQWCRAEAAQDVFVVSNLITQVRRGLENELGRSLLSQTITAWFDAADVTYPLWLPLPPAIAITSVTTYDGDDTSSVVDSGNYRIAGLDPGRVQQVGAGFDAQRDTDGLKIIYTAGYGTAATDIPSAIMLEMHRRLCEHFVHRGWMEANNMRMVDPTGDLLAAYRYDHICA